MLQICNLSKKYGKHIVLDSVNLSIEKGKIIAIVGPNGSGKTTLFKIVLKLIKKYQGELIETKDLNVTGVVEDPIFFLFMSGKENLRYLLGEKKMKRIDTFIKYFGMEDYIEKPVCKYSLGMKQRLALVYIFGSDTDLLVLDEPTNALDPLGVHQFKKMIIQEKQHGKSILIATHHLTDLSEYCDHIYLLRSGRLEELSTNNYQKAMFIFKFLIEYDSDIVHDVENYIYCLVNKNELHVKLNRDEVPHLISVLSKYKIIGIYEKTQSLSNAYMEKIEGE